MNTTIFVGLNVHKATVAVADAIRDAGNRPRSGAAGPDEGQVFLFMLQARIARSNPDTPRIFMTRFML